MTNKYNTVLYVGSTSNIARRVFEHKNNSLPGSFTSRYRVNKLVYLEVYSLYTDAAARERQLKAGSRQKKVDLITSANPQWKDLSEEAAW